MSQAATVKAIRERLGVSQRALGDGIGCTQSNVGHYERGAQELPAAAAKRLLEFARSRGLQLTLDQVYGEQPLPWMLAARVQMLSQQAAKG